MIVANIVSDNSNRFYVNLYMCRLFLSIPYSDKMPGPTRSELDREKNLIFRNPTEHSTGQSLRIDEKTLADRPLLPNFKHYLDLSGTVTDLTLHNVPEEEMEWIFMAFSTCRNLTLENVEIRSKEVDYLPKDIVSLTLIKCKWNSEVQVAWFKAIHLTLRSIRICDFDVRGLGLLRSVEHISLEHNLGYFYNFELPNLAYLYYNPGSFPGRGSDIDKLLDGNKCKDALRTLVIKECPEDVGILEKYRNLKNLRILTPVDWRVEVRLFCMRKWQSFDVRAIEGRDYNIGSRLKLMRWYRGDVKT